MRIDRADDILAHILGPDLQAATLRLVGLLVLIAAIAATASFFAA